MILLTALPQVPRGGWEHDDQRSDERQGGCSAGHDGPYVHQGRQWRRLRAAEAAARLLLLRGAWLPASFALQRALSIAKWLTDATAIELYSHGAPRLKKNCQVGYNIVSTR